MEHVGSLRVPAIALMEQTGPPDIVALESAFDAAEQDARRLIDGLTEARGTWRVHAGS